MSLNLKDLFEFGKSTLRSTLLTRENTNEFDWNTWHQLGRSGFFRMLASHQWNGSYGTIADFTKSIFTLSKGSMDIPFVVSVGAQVMACSIISKFGTEKQKNNFLPGAYSGDLVLGISNSELGAGTDLKRIRSLVKKQNHQSNIGDVEIQKSVANNVPYADAVIASAWLDSGEPIPALAVFLIDLADDSSAQIPVKCTGFRTGAVGALNIKNDQVDIADLQLGTNGPEIMRYCYNLERYLIPVCLAGVLDGLLEETVSFCKSRKSFGKTLDTFQFNQEKIIQIYQAKETIWSLIQLILSELKSPREFSDDDARLSLLKFKSVEDAYSSATGFLELCGGQGYQTDHLAQKLVRDILGLKFLGGTKEQHKLTIMSAIGARNNLTTTRDANESKSTKTA